MDTTQKKTRRRYTDEEKAAALVALRFSLLRRFRLSFQFSPNQERSK
jgi:hypothetical protein